MLWSSVLVAGLSDGHVQMQGAVTVVCWLLMLWLVCCLLSVVCCLLSVAVVRCLRSVALFRMTPF